MSGSLFEGRKLLDRPRVYDEACQTCGMALYDFREFHPYAACQVFMATDDPEMVWAVIKPMLERGEAGRLPENHPFVKTSATSPEAFPDPDPDRVPGSAA